MSCDCLARLEIELSRLHLHQGWPTPLMWEDLFRAVRAARPLTPREQELADAQQQADLAAKFENSNYAWAKWAREYAVPALELHARFDRTDSAGVALGMRPKS